MCLCGMLGAEVESLPPDVAAEVRTFFEQNIEWLAAAISRPAGKAPADGAPSDGAPSDGVAAERQALTILAMLEGALVVARTMRRDEVFDRIAEAITTLAPPDR